MFELRHLRHGAGAVVLLAGLTAVSGCRKTADASQVASNTGPDPADVNQAPVGAVQGAVPAAQPARTRVLGQSQSAQPQQTATTYLQQAAPIERAPDPENYTPPQSYANDPSYQSGDENFDQTIDQYAAEEPPPLPVYEQPPCPEPNYIWTPGYWSYAPAGYYWVPGAWAAPPYYGALWTPGYWGFMGNRYGFHRGFWGLHIGFYGGIAYGFGYTGSGYHGGYWNGNNFYYNRAVNRVNETTIHNTYVRNLTINNTVIHNRISYNGGRGGVQARPAAYEVAAMRERHTPPMAAQVQLREQSQQNRQQFYSANHGRPAAVVAARPLAADRGIAAPQREPSQQGVRPEAQGIRPEAQSGRTVQGGFGGGQPRGNEAPQRDAQPGLRNQQEQQRNAPQQEQQRNLQLQQSQQNQQQQLQLQQRNQQEQQQRNSQQQQEQQRNQQLQHSRQGSQQVPMQPRNEPPRSQPQPPVRNEQPQQPRVQERPQAQPQPQRVAPQAQPRPDARPEGRPAERPHPEGHPPR